MNISVASRLAGQAARSAIFEGDILIDAATPITTALLDHARLCLQEAFAPLGPTLAQFSLPLAAFIDVIAAVKTKFTNDAKTKDLMCALLRAQGHDPATTYFDVPRLRVVTAAGFLRAGVGYAYRPHRDTWYAAPAAQINWWLPLADLEASQALVFYPRYFNRAIANTSATFDYEHWQIHGRPAAHAQGTLDTRNHPIPLDPIDPADEIRPVLPADFGLRFSAAHLHATAENTAATTRFSIDFRTFDIDDLQAGRGARNVDAAATGSTCEDFLNLASLAPYHSVENRVSR